MASRYDIIVFGASGYTGKYVIREAIKILKDFRWAVAGRNKQKLEDNLKEIGIRENVDLSKIPIVIADINDEKSLTNMTKQAKVIVNCCGPYRFFGEQVVKACVETATNHVDVSGEPQYMETMQLKYNDAAREKGIHIVSACGFDSIPADLGVLFLQREFKGTVNLIETYLRSYFLNDYNPKGPGVYYATYESAVHGFANSHELKGIRRQLFPTRMPRMQPAFEEKPKLHKSKDANNRWSLSIPSSDHSVVMRSQRYFYENEKQRPIQFRSFNTYDSIVNALKTIVAGMMLNFMTKYDAGKSMLLKYPNLFSFGFADRDGPSELRNAITNFETLFVGKGWKEVFPDATAEIKIPMNKEIVTRVICNNPLYGAASKAVLLSAVTILQEKEKLPDNGGVFSPAAAFKNTRLIKMLQDNGLVFEVLKVNELKAKL